VLPSMPGSQFVLFPHSAQIYFTHSYSVNISNNTKRRRYKGLTSRTRTAGFHVVLFCSILVPVHILCTLGIRAVWLCTKFNGVKKGNAGCRYTKFGTKQFMYISTYCLRFVDQ
jgi:hypothetical protein